MIAPLLFLLSFGIAASLVKSRRNYRALPEIPVCPAAPAPDITFIIPARNEAPRIDRVVHSLAGYPVLVVDDGSSDGTAAIAAAAGAKVVAAPALQPAAKGKPNACLAGARHVTSEWICFVDADTWFEPRFAPSLVSYAEKENLDLLTAFLDSQKQTAFEKLLLPYAFALYFVGVSAKAVNSPRSREALANGQCMLFRGSSYHRMGGHGAVLNSVVEDVVVARIAKLHGLRMRVVRAEQLGHVRMYDSFTAIWRGFQKNSFRFLLINPLTGAQVIAASILLTSWLPALVYALATGVHGWGWPAVATLIVAPSIALWPWYESNWALLAPVSIYLFQFIALDGMLSTVTRRRAVWKGRRV